MIMYLKNAHSEKESNQRHYRFQRAHLYFLHIIITLCLSENLIYISWPTRMLSFQYVEKLDKIIRFAIKVKTLTLEDLDTIWNAQVSYICTQINLQDALLDEFLFFAVLACKRPQETVFPAIARYPAQYHFI